MRSFWEESIFRTQEEEELENEYKNANGGLPIGSTAAQWKTSLLLIKRQNSSDAREDNVRSRIAAKILLHEVNIHQKKMSDYAKKMNGAGEGGSNQE
ncbi:hypothetical protein Tco_0005948 [Tanacetum coccineum]